MVSGILAHVSAGPLDPDVQDGSVHIQDILASFLESERKWRRVVHLYAESIVSRRESTNWHLASLCSLKVVLCWQSLRWTLNTLRLYESSTDREAISIYITVEGRGSRQSDYCARTQQTFTNKQEAEAAEARNSDKSANTKVVKRDTWGAASGPVLI